MIKEKEEFNEKFIADVLIVVYFYFIERSVYRLVLLQRMANKL